jgi:hypothetical protein
LAGGVGGWWLEVEGIVVMRRFLKFVHGKGWFGQVCTVPSGLCEMGYGHTLILNKRNALVGRRPPMEM